MRYDGFIISLVLSCVECGLLVTYFLYQVFQVLLKWSHGLKCDALSSDDISYLKECLLQSEFRILPALQDKWVSLHPSFGLVCWSDDDALKKELKHKDNIEFLYFGELMDNEKEMLETNVSVLLQNLGIPAVSKVCILLFVSVSREQSS